MKKLLLIIIILVLHVNVFAQFTIKPSKGDRFSYFLNGDVWEATLTIKSEFALKRFISTDNFSSTWILNLSLTEKELISLKDYLDKLPDINIGTETMMSNSGEDNWRLNSFKIHSSDYYENSVGEDTPPNLQYIMKMIQLYFKNH